MSPYDEPEADPALDVEAEPARRLPAHAGQAPLALRFVAIFYGAMAALGLALCLGLGLPWWSRGPALGPAWAPWAGALVGVGVGVLAVLISQALEAKTDWASRLSRGFEQLIGPQPLYATVAMALASSVGEELLFRAFLQQALELKLLVKVMTPEAAAWAAVGVCGAVFGLVHIGPDWRTFWPWTVMAVIMGWVLGGLLVWTGSLWAPVMAHLTVNAINLTLIARASASRPAA